MLDKNIQILTGFEINVDLPDIEKKIKTSGNSGSFMDTARKVLTDARGSWEPACIFQWVDYKNGPDKTMGQLMDTSQGTIQLNLGSSIQFLTNARNVMVCAYTIGSGLDTIAAKASSKGRLLEAYMIDLIGLAALDKTEAVLIRHAEETAKALGWGVSPFLSPGSVHGWELEEQAKLCALLPINKINMTIERSSVLHPLKSICAVIGIGPGYHSKKVGNPCDVCNNKDTCEMRDSHA